MRFYKAKITKVNKDLGYFFATTNTKKHEVFCTVPKEVIHYFKINREIKVAYINTERGYFVIDYIY